MTTHSLPDKDETRYASLVARLRAANAVRINEMPCGTTRLELWQLHGQVIIIQAFVDGFDVYVSATKENDINAVYEALHI